MHPMPLAPAMDEDIQNSSSLGDCLGGERTSLIVSLSSSRLELGDTN